MIRLRVHTDGNQQKCWRVRPNPGTTVRLSGGRVRPRHAEVFMSDRPPPVLRAAWREIEPGKWLRLVLQSRFLQWRGTGPGDSSGRKMVL